MKEEILSAAESRRARRELGLTQQKAADQSGLGRTKISWLEGGRMTPDVEFLETLRDFYEGRGVEFDREPGEAAAAAVDDDQDEAAAGEKQPKRAQRGERARDEGDEVSRKRRQRAEESEPSEPSSRKARGNSYRGGLRIAPDVPEDTVDSLLDQIEENDQRIGALVGEKTGDGVERDGWLFGEGELKLSGEDREAHEELIQRMAANYVLVGLLQGKPVIAPCEDEVALKPEQATDHGELVAASVVPYVCGPVPGDKAEAKMDRKKRDSAERRRAQLDTVQ
jgi:transcriptional regulator with XRE-family HTH domain